MKLKFLLLCTAFLLYSCVSAIAQNQYILSPCNLSKSQKFVGDRLRLPLPKGTIVKKGRDIDYENYYVGFGKKKNRVWLSGIHGPTASGGKVSKDWLSTSSDITQRTWKFGKDEGVDTKGKLANGNYWRYLGRLGEEIKYYDVPSEAATYFDSIIKGLCYQEWKQ
ncbi:MAG: hypothetical protein H0U87_08115 [Acidobacteria bacterium]|jgi:hypothetical protein|nr:hypothetical protein [Acidobacteriota bacterium]